MSKWLKLCIWLVIIKLQKVTNILEDIDEEKP